MRRRHSLKQEAGIPASILQWRFAETDGRTWSLRQLHGEHIPPIECTVTRGECIGTIFAARK